MLAASDGWMLRKELQNMQLGLGVSGLGLITIIGTCKGSGTCRHLRELQLDVCLGWIWEFPEISGTLT